MKVLHIVLFAFIVVISFGCISTKPKPQVQLNLPHDQKVLDVSAAPTTAPGAIVYSGQKVPAKPVAQTEGSENVHDGWVGYSGHDGGAFRSRMIRPDPYRTGRDYYHLSAPSVYQLHIQGGGPRDLLGRHKKHK